MNSISKRTIRFWRGRSFYEVASAYDGSAGFVGLRDGRIIARGSSKFEVAGDLIRDGGYPKAA